MHEVIKHSNKYSLLVTGSNCILFVVTYNYNSFPIPVNDNILMHLTNCDCSCINHFNFIHEYMVSLTFLEVNWLTGIISQCRVNHGVNMFQTTTGFPLQSTPKKHNLACLKIIYLVCTRQ